jgi:hypothetical protein
VANACCAQSITLPAPLPTSKAYCDGTSQTSDLDLPLVFNGTTLHLRGRALLDAHMATLDSELNFTSSATEVVVSGTSAGGLSTHLHASFFAARVPSARTVAAPDAAWWWDTTAYGDPSTRPWLQSIQPALQLWNATIRGPSADACLAANPGEARVRCWTQPYAHYYSTVPTFHIQSLYDTANLAYCFRMPCGLPYTPPSAESSGRVCNATEIAAIQDFHTRLLANIVAAEERFGTRDGHFLTSCSQHEESCRAEDFFGISITGVKMSAALSKWYASAGKESVVYVDVPWPGDGTCRGDLVHGAC